MKTPSMHFLELLTRWKDHQHVLKESEEKFMKDFNHMLSLAELINKQGEKEGFTSDEIIELRDTNPN